MSFRNVKEFYNYKLENMHWISIPVHIGDPIGVTYGGATWRVMFEKNYRPNY